MISDAAQRSEHRKCRVLELTASLFPVLQGVHADSDVLREAELGQPDAPPEGRNVIAGLERSVVREPRGGCLQHRSRTPAPRPPDLPGAS